MRRFIIITLVAFLAVIVFLFTVSTRLHDRALATTERELAGRAQLLALSSDRTLQTRLSEAFTFSALPSLRGFAVSDEASRPARIATAQSELQAIVAADPAIRAASIVDTNGKVILTTDDAMTADWSNRVFVRQGMVGHPYAAPPSRDFGEVSQYYSAPIIDNSGNVGGILVLRVLGQELWDLVLTTPNVLVLDENGVRLADTTTAPQIFTAIAPLPNDTIAQVVRDQLYGAEISQLRVMPFLDLAAQLKNRRVVQTVLRDPNGGAFLTAIYPLQTNPWSVVVLARDDALGFLSMGYLEALGWGALGGLLLAALAYFTLKA